MENRRRGAAKAAATRRARKRTPAGDSAPTPSSPVTGKSCPDEACYFGVCGKEYVEQTDTVEVWIGCDMCDVWYCLSCGGLTDAPESDYICTKCR